jgi:hypothetical protein
MLTNHQARTLRKLRGRSLEWELGNLPGVGQATWDRLVTLGFLEERRDTLSSQRYIRLTDRGRRFAEGCRY